MHETAIARFLAGQATAAELEGEGGELSEEFVIEFEMLERFVEAAKRGELSPETVAAAARMIVDSDHLVWADDIVESAVYHLAMSTLDPADPRSWLYGKPTPWFTGRAPMTTDGRTRMAVLMICGGVCILAEAIVFIGNATAGPSFADSALGMNLFMFGIAFFAVSFFLIFALARP